MTKKTRTNDWQNFIKRMFGKISLKECLEGGRRLRKIPNMVLTIVKNNDRTLRPTLGIIRQPRSESSIDRVVVSCKYP